jgi:16S rRNA pseudouridine516 synthase
MPILRLDRMLSSQGFGTRREIKKMLSGGHVTVRGKAVSNPSLKIDTDKDEVCIDGNPLVYREYIYIMMNKPSGIISASDDHREKTVIDLLPPELQRPGLFPAGRLDRDTEGFLLITNDGMFAHNILSPRKHVEKKYFVSIDKPLTEKQAESFRKGLVIDGGIVCRSAGLEAADDDSGGKNLIVTIHEGKYHQIKRMFAALGANVIYLKRIAIGGLALDSALASGAARELTDDELKLIISSQKNDIMK